MRRLTTEVLAWICRCEPRERRVVDRPAAAPDRILYIRVAPVLHIRAGFGYFPAYRSIGSLSVLRQEMHAPAEVTVVA